MATLAALDLGTNSTRVLVGEGDGSGGISPLARQNTITRLGQGVDGSGRLASEAIERTVDCVRSYVPLLDQHGVERRPGHVRITATSAARDAANRDELFDAVEREVGVRPELLSGTAEGELTFRGAAGELDPAGDPVVVVDIGGGSTEFMVGSHRNGQTGRGQLALDGVVSVDIGCVRITEQYIESDPPRPEELTAAISVTEAFLDDVFRDLPAVGEARTVVGVAGTITTAAAVELGLITYDRDKVHHFRLSRDAAEDVFRTLATENREDRAHNPGLEAARVDVIVGGLCVLVALYRRLGLEEILVSEADILDGLLLSLLEAE